MRGSPEESPVFFFFLRGFKQSQRAITPCNAWADKLEVSKDRQHLLVHELMWIKSKNLKISGLGREAVVAGSKMPP